MTSKCFALNPFKRTDFVKVRAQCESNALLTYLKLSTVLELSFPKPVKMLILFWVAPEKYCTNVCCYLVTQIQTYHIQTRSNSSFPIYLKILKAINMRLSSIKSSDDFKIYFRAAVLTF